MGVELEKTCLVQADLAAISTMSGHVLVLLERCGDSYRPGQVLCLIRLPKEALDKLRAIFNHSPYLGP